MTLTHTGPIASAELARSESGSEILLFRNRFWHLEVSLEPTINPHFLKHLQSGQVLADENYCYQVELESAQDHTTGFRGDACSASSARLIEWNVEEDAAAGTAKLTIVGRLDFGQKGPTDLIVEHSFTLFGDKDRFDEQISLGHRYGHDSHVVSRYRFGFRKRMFDARSATWLDHMDEYRLGGVPFRRRRGQAKDFLKEDYSAADIVPANWDGNNLPNRQSEAWSWQNGETGFCFAKYNQDHIEFSAVDCEFYSPPTTESLDGLTGHAEVDNACFRFGGAARIKGAPGTPVAVDGNSRTFRFGTSSIIPFEGGWVDGHKAYGAFLRDKGHVTPKGFNPPVHWNELYNLSWRGGNNAPLQELPELLEEARRAQIMGAEAFYFDPVWDTFEGSNIWDEARLGPLPEFVARLRDEYGLSLSLHLMMHTRSTEENPDIYRRGPDGEISLWDSRLYVGGHICGGSKAWQDHKTERLLKLARDGVSFFMFDFTEFRIAGTDAGIVSAHATAEPCWAADHGHAVPLSTEAHSRGIIEVMKRVKRDFPDLLIEAHDRLAGGAQDYLPLYYEHGLDEPTYDEHWGFEYMWNPYMDLVSGKALSLYEYNLAFDIPLYLHINLRFDNDNALAFWWYASTCRHLGIGGLKPGDAIWDSHVSAMQTYMRLKPNFAQGRFVGLDLDLHGHVLAEEKTAVFVAFNRSSRDVSLFKSVPLDELGLPHGAVPSGEGIAVEEGIARFSTQMPGLSAYVFELSWV
jgi:hypothetical protein